VVVVPFGRIVRNRQLAGIALLLPAIGDQDAPSSCPTARQGCVDCQGLVRVQKEWIEERLASHFVWIPEPQITAKQKTKTTYMQNVTNKVGVSGKSIGLRPLARWTAGQHPTSAAPGSLPAESIKPPSSALAMEANVVGASLAKPLDDLGRRYAQNVMYHMKNKQPQSQRNLKPRRLQSPSRRNAA